MSRTMTLEEFCKTDKAKANSRSWEKVANVRQACDGCGDPFHPTEDHPELCESCLSADAAELDRHAKLFG